MIITNVVSENQNGTNNNNSSAGIGCLGWVIVLVLLYLLGSCFNDGGSSSGYGSEKCFRCKGAGMVNEGFLDFQTCSTCGGSGILDSH